MTEYGFVFIRSVAFKGISRYNYKVFHVKYKLLKCKATRKKLMKYYGMIAIFFKFYGISSVKQFNKYSRKSINDHIVYYLISKYRGFIIVDYESKVVT